MYEMLLFVSMIQQPCFGCHTDVTPSLMDHFLRTAHNKVECLKCHTPLKTDKYPIDHNGFIIVTKPSSNMCVQICHNEKYGNLQKKRL